MQKKERQRRRVVRPPLVQEYQFEDELPKKGIRKVPITLAPIPSLHRPLPWLVPDDDPLTSSTIHEV